MSRLAHCLLVLVVLTLAFATGRAAAQENLDAGKQPAQLFANDCSACHKSPAGLSKAPGLFGLESFLREHYTASRQSAAAIASYLRAVDAEQAARAPAKRRKSEPRPKAADKPVKRQEDDKAATEPSSSKTDAKSDSKPDAKPAGDKPAEPKAAKKSKPGDAKPAETKPADSKPAEPPAASAPAAGSSTKPDKPN